MKQLILFLTVFFMFLISSCEKQSTNITIITSDPSSISSTTAFCRGVITGVLTDGSISDKGVCWDTSPNPTTSNSKTSDGSSCEHYIYGSLLSNLTPNTIYYVRAFVIKSTSTIYGNEISFKTLPTKLPVVTTVVPNNITSTSAKSGGRIDSIGDFVVASKGICWTTTPFSTAYNRITNGSGNDAFLSDLINLKENTTYYICAFASDNTITIYGNQYSFTTLKQSNDTIGFRKTLMPIFNNTCSGCHDGINQDPNFSTDAASVYATINIPTYINRTNPAQSYIYTHILDASHGGGQFPNEASKILSWINFGAKNN